jgi:hypothetical protein
MNYHILDPEVVGEFGDNVDIDTSVHPPLVRHLHLEFDVWLGDDLVQTFPCYLVTERLRGRLAALDATGASYAPVEMSESDSYMERHPGKKPPELVWLKVTGRAGKDDFGLTGAARLVVSDRVLRLMQSMTLEHCEVEPFVG